MEQKLEIISAITTTNNKNSNKSHDQNGLFIKKKKRSSPMHILRVAMHMFSFKTRKSKSAQVQAASTLYNVVGSMRPLHLQSNQSPRLLEAAVPVPEMDPNRDSEPKPVMTKTDELIEQFEVYTPPLSPAQPSSSSASSSCGTASRYASANDLQELGRRYKGTEFDKYDDNDDEYDEDEEDKYYDDKRGDEMIDFKAQEFIAKFYEQIRLQQEAYSTKRC